MLDSAIVRLPAGDHGSRRDHRRGGDEDPEHRARRTRARVSAEGGQRERARGGEPRAARRSSRRRCTSTIPRRARRLSNGVFIPSSGTTQIVAGLYRALADPRVTFVDAGINAQDAPEPRLFRQTKYPNFTAPIRIASGLEARYIAAEAQLKINGTRRRR